MSEAGKAATSAKVVSTPASRHADAERAKRYYRDNTFDREPPRSMGTAEGVAVPDDYEPLIEGAKSGED